MRQRQDYSTRANDTRVPCRQCNSRSPASRSVVSGVHHRPRHLWRLSRNGIPQKVCPRRWLCRSLIFFSLWTRNLITFPFESNMTWRTAISEYTALPRSALHVEGDEHVCECETRCKVNNLYHHKICARPIVYLSPYCVLYLRFRLCTAGEDAPTPCCECSHARHCFTTRTRKRCCVLGVGTPRRRWQTCISSQVDQTSPSNDSTDSNRLTHSLNLASRRIDLRAGTHYII